VVITFVGIYFDTVIQI